MRLPSNPLLEPPHPRHPFTPIRRPYKTPRHRRSKRNRDHDNLKRFDEYRNSTRIWRLANLTTPNIERIDNLANPPWMKTIFDDDIRSRIHIHTPPHATPNPNAKKEWAEYHKIEAQIYAGDKSNIAIYTDGSLSKDKDGNRLTGWGVIAFNDTTIIARKNGSGGQFMEVYDMETAALCEASIVIRNLHESHRLNTISNIRVYADNTSAIQTIWKGDHTSNQTQHQIFRRNIFLILSSYPHIHITIEWVPGHHKIKGNNIADQLAKEGSKLPLHHSLHVSRAFTKSYGRKLFRKPGERVGSPPGPGRHRNIPRSTHLHHH